MDLDLSGSIKVTTQLLEATLPEQSWFGTVTLTSLLFDGATSVDILPREPAPRLEEVLAGRAKEEPKAAPAAAAPSFSQLPEQDVARAAQKPPSAVISGNTVTVTLPPDVWSSITSTTTSFKVVS